MKKKKIVVFQMVLNWLSQNVSRGVSKVINQISR